MKTIEIRLSSCHTYEIKFSGLVEIPDDTSLHIFYIL